MLINNVATPTLKGFKHSSESTPWTNSKKPKPTAKALLTGALLNQTEALDESTYSSWYLQPFFEEPPHNETAFFLSICQIN
jgi:hypothetical protein